MSEISNKRIYEMARKKYIVEKNKELLSFMKKAIKKGYQPTM